MLKKVAYKSLNARQKDGDKEICAMLFEEIERALPDAENKIWHASPVWFLDGNPIVAYSKLKNCVRLLFWSGQSFDEPDLKPEGSFKAAEMRYTSASRKELSFYRKMTLPIPRIHPDQRHYNRLKFHNFYKLWSAKCTNCSAEIETIYSPEMAKKVFCEKCYLKEVY